MTAVAVTIFEIDAMGKTVSGVSGRGLSALVVPTPSSSFGRPEGQCDSGGARLAAAYSCLNASTGF